MLRVLARSTAASTLHHMHLYRYTHCSRALKCLLNAGQCISYLDSHSMQINRKGEQTSSNRDAGASRAEITCIMCKEALDKGCRSTFLSSAASWQQRSAYYGVALAQPWPPQS